MIGRVRRFSSLLQEKDDEVWNHLNELQVQPLFYSVRWLLLMLTQDLEMPDIFRVWDTLLSDLARPHPFLHYLCVAMVVLVREALLAADFSDCLKTLQRYPPLPIDDILALAKQLRSADLVPGGFSNKDLAKESSLVAQKARQWFSRLSSSPDAVQGQSGPAGWFSRLGQRGGFGST